MKLAVAELEKKSREIRREIVRLAAKAGASHVASALSVVDILTVLYFSELNVDLKKTKNKDRDIIILSKGHGGLALYVTLAHRGFFPIPKLESYCASGSKLTGHPMIESVPGVEATTGSLGHGLAIGLGMALAAKRDDKKSRVFVILSDGELDEGSTWEAILAAGQFKLDNLVAIVDYNKIQSFGFVKEIMDLEPMVDKWLSFNWEAVRIDGHDMQKLVEGICACPINKGKPTVIIADTVKGKGVSFMENKVEWHYKSPDENQLTMALAELK